MCTVHNVHYTPYLTRWWGVRYHDLDGNSHTLNSIVHNALQKAEDVDARNRLLGECSILLSAGRAFHQEQTSRWTAWIIRITSVLGAFLCNGCFYYNRQKIFHEIEQEVRQANPPPLPSAPPPPPGFAPAPSVPPPPETLQPPPLPSFLGSPEARRTLYNRLPPYGKGFASALSVPQEFEYITYWFWKEPTKENCLFLQRAFLPSQDPYPSIRIDVDSGQYALEGDQGWRGIPREDCPYFHALRTALVQFATP